jgi:hypothetical protein
MEKKSNSLLHCNSRQKDSVVGKIKYMRFINISSGTCNDFGDVLASNGEVNLGKTLI